uniref:Shisa N-terminal domain-containing protein n=1 Tax=Eptatretus burgeri TaxID=7764 RepID=A0A8C4R4H3_EPTBU
MLRIVCLIVVIAKGTLLFTVFAGPSMEAITTLTFERCRGYYDVSGHFDPPFECNMSAYRLCCGTCFYRFCCMFEVERLDQVSCNNYESPKWASDTLSTSSSISDSREDEILTPPGITAYIVCGVVGVVVILGALIARCGVLRSSHGDDVQDAAGRDGTAGALSHLLHNQPIAVVQMRNEGLHPSTPRCTARKAHGT